MAEPSNELLLQVLRAVQSDLSEMRRDMGDMRREIAEVRSDLKDVNQKVDGLAVILTLLTGHVHHIERRVEALETVKP